MLMRKSKMVSLCLTFLTGGALAAFASKGPVNAWAKDSNGNCILACSSEGKITCNIAPVCYLSEIDCRTKVNPIPCFVPEEFK